MILVVDLCWKEDSLSRFEFVAPIERILRSACFETEVRHYAAVTGEECARADGVVLCGTALMDNAFAEDLERFSWLRTCGCPVLGICAGMQAVAAAYGGGVEEVCEIGMTGVSVVGDDPLFAGIEHFEAYELHGFAARPPDSFAVLAVSESCVQAVKHRSLPVYGVMFHPEVRNEWVVERFAAMTRGGNSDAL